MALSLPGRGHVPGQDGARLRARADQGSAGARRGRGNERLPGWASGAVARDHGELPKEKEGRRGAELSSGALAGPGEVEVGRAGADLRDVLARELAGVELEPHRALGQGLEPVAT